MTYPILKNGHTAGVEVAYDCESSFVFVVGGDGVILYRGFFVDAEVRAAIDDGLAALGPTAAPDRPGTGHDFAGAAPNPFNPATRLRFSLDPRGGAQPARLEILDLRGRVVSVLLDGPVPADRPLDVLWRGTDGRGRKVASGVYLARLTVGSWQALRPLTLLK